MANLRIVLVPYLMTAVVASLAASSSSSSLASSSLARSSIKREGLNTMVLRARQWLRTHEDPDQAGMEELKSTNPDAYAIVQALITKKSLGLLNPRHPNAFGGYQDAPGAKGTMPTTVVDAEPQVPLAAVSTETQHASHSDFFNWKPHDDDDSIVSNVESGAVPSSSEKVASSPVEMAPLQPEPQKIEPVKVAAPTETSNSDLTDTGPVVKSATASMSQENSYLNSAGLEHKQSAPVHAHGNALASFSWNDDDSAPASTPVAAQPKISGGNALVNFLR